MASPRQQPVDPLPQGRGRGLWALAVGLARAFVRGERDERASRFESRRSRLFGYDQYRPTITSMCTSVHSNFRPEISRYRIPGATREPGDSTRDANLIVIDPEVP